VENSSVAPGWGFEHAMNMGVGPSGFTVTTSVQPAFKKLIERKSVHGAPDGSNSESIASREFGTGDVVSIRCLAEQPITRNEKRKIKYFMIFSVALKMQIKK
jgi:hypothetical protein